MGVKAGSFRPLRRLFGNRRGTAEIVGSVMFLVILLFFFSNVVLWHDRASREMDDVVTDKLNSKIEVRCDGVDTIYVTNKGGVGVALSRLWIDIASEEAEEPLYADLENIEGDIILWLSGGSTIELKLNPDALESESPVDVIWNNQLEVAVVQYSPNRGDVFKILTNQGNMASDTFRVPGINMVKVADKESAMVGETITYTFTVTNTGEIPLASVTVTDNVAGAATYESGDFNEDEILGLDETWIFTVDWTVAENPDPLENTATASGYYEGVQVIDTDTWTADVLRTGVEITKAANVETALVGQTITYTIRVTNTGEVDLYITSLSDALLGSLTVGDYIPGGVIAVASYVEFTIPYTVQAADVGTLPNTMTVNGQNAEGEDSVGNSASDSVDVLSSGINVVKSGPSSATVGETITYNYDVTLAGTAPLSGVSVVDSVSGATTGPVSGDDGDNILEVGETWIFTDTWVVATSPDNLVNEATASGSDGINTYTDTDTWTADVLRTGVEITKAANVETVLVGENVTYTIRVTNTGEVDLYITSLDDSLLGDLASEISGGVITLIEGYEEFTVNYTVQAADVGTLPNTATVNGQNYATADLVSDSASDSVSVLSSGINVVKSGPSSAMVGETITYTFTVTNTGEIPLASVTVTDNVAGVATLMASNATHGDLDSDGLLDLDETWIFTVDWTVAESPDPLVNEATASGSDGINTYTDTDTWTADVLRTGVEITKAANVETALVGQTVTYTLNVSNTGEAPLYVSSVSDSLLGDLSSYIVGPIAVDSYVEFSVQYTVLESDENPLINTVTVFAENEFGEDVVSDDDVSSVDILYPGINVVKVADKESALVGELITYTLTVENTGGTTLAVTWSDTLGLTPVFSYEESGDGDGDFEPGEVWVYTADYTVLISDPDPLLNTVTVRGTDGEGNYYEDSDSEAVDILYGNILIEKSGPSSASVGETVTYTIRVTNTGEVDLYITSLDDSLLGDLASEISGGVITLIEGYEEFTVNYTVQAADVGTLPNTVTVFAENVFGEDVVSDSDGHSVIIDSLIGSEV